MRVNELTLKNFRNYDSQIFKPGKGTNIIYGDNAQGKTNILEAIHLFSQGRSCRAKSDRELIAFDSDYARVCMEFSDVHRDFKAFIQLSADGRKSIKINEVPITKLSMLMSYFNVVMFTPEDLSMIKGSPSCRRRFVDEAISQMYPKYLNNLMQYHRVLKQKSSLLKALRQRGTASDATLTIWNEQLAEYACEVMCYRHDFLQDMNKSAGEIYEEIGKEKMQIHYTPSVKCDIIDKDGLKDGFLDFIERQQRREIEFGACLYGIQRDDVEFEIDGNEAKMYGSQGQQRSIVLSLKMAQTDYIFDKKGEYPVLLLDDVMSELDLHRRSYLAERIKDKQVFITCTDAEDVSGDADTQVFHVHGGHIEE